MPTESEPRVGIIGAGLSGICVAIMLRDKLGLEERQIVGVERWGEVGGTWFACDVPGHLYQYSFAANPNWSCPYPGQPELLNYIKSVADKFAVRHLFSYNTKVTRSIWNEDLGVWTVYYKSLPSTNSPESPASDADLPEESFDCEFLYNTNRITNEPGLPLIPGAIEGEFKGEWWHSMRWPSNGLARLQGKKVAMIGCAAAAVQLVPQIAKVAGSLAVYHRTPNYVLHRPNQPYDEEQKRRWAADPMEYRLWRAKWEHDFARNWVYGALHDGSVEQLSCIADARDNLDSNIADPKLREILWPDFPLWCRRTVYHDDFYPALELPHVELVQERIVRTSSTGIISALQNPRDKEIDTLAPEVSREFDVIVYATGWAATGNKKPSAPVIGRNGVEFSQRAVNLVPDGPEGISYQGYLGVMLDGFPNYFTLTRGGFFYSLIASMEENVEFSLKLIRRAISKNLKLIVPTFEAVRSSLDKFEALTKDAPFTKGDCSGYYKLFRPSGTVANGNYTVRGLYPGMPSEMHSFLEWPIWKDFEEVPNEEGKVWRWPTVKRGNRLEEALDAGIFVV